MANNKRKFVVSLEIDSKTAEQQIKASAKNISAILENMNKSGDSMTYFKELVGYISKLDSEMSAFKKKHGADTFNKMFGSLDATLTNQMQDLFGTTKQQLAQIEALRKRISDARSKKDLSVDEAKAIEQDVRALYGAIGNKSDMALSAAKKPQNILLHSEKALDKFVMKWEDVNDRLSKGFNFGTGSTGGIDTGLEHLSQEVQSEVNKIQKEIDELEAVKDKYNNIMSKWQESKDSKNKDMVYADEFKPDTSLEGVQKLINEIDTLQKEIKTAEAGTIEYYNTLNKLGEASIKLENSRKAILKDDDLKKQFQNTKSSDPSLGIHKLGEMRSYSITQPEQIFKSVKSIDKFIDAKRKEIEVVKQAKAIEQQSDSQNAENIAKDTNNIKAKSTAYDQLIAKVREYIQLSEQFDNAIDDDEIDSLAGDKEDLEMQIAEMSKLGDKAEEVCDILGRLSFNKLTEGEALSQLVDTLGVEIPQSAEKAESALKELDGASEKSSDSVADVQKTITSYEELCRVVERYNQLITKTNRTKQEDEEIASITSRIAETKTGGDINKAINHAMAFRNLTDQFTGTMWADTIANYLGIEVPGAAEKAESALQELSTESEKVGNNAADFNKVEGALEDVESQAKQTANAIDRIGDSSNVKQTDLAEQKVYNKDQTPDVDASSEIQQLERLEAQVKEVTAAIEAKTNAFQAEGVQVNSVVQKEIGDLEQLVVKLKEVENRLESTKNELKNMDNNADSKPMENDSSLEIQELEQLKGKVKEVTQAVEAKTQAFQIEGDVVNQVVTQEIMALDSLSTYLDTIYKSINNIVDGLNRINSTKLNNAVSDELQDSAKDSSKDTSTDSKKNKTFDEIRNDEISSFERYRRDAESSIHITDEFKGRLATLRSALDHVGDADGLNAWKQSFSELQSEFGRYQDASQKVLTGQINSIKKEAKDAMKGLDLDIPTDDPAKRAQQEAIAQGFKEIQIASEMCASQVKSNQNVEISALNATKQQLLENINTYKKQYGLLNSGGKSGKNYGSTAIIRETTRYNQFQQYANDDSAGFKNSGAFNAKLQEYTNAYNRLIAIREKLSSKPVLTDRDVQEFNDAKQAAANYGKELDKMIAKSQKLASNSFRMGEIGSDVNVDDALSRKQALTDFVMGMHDARESTIKFSNDYQECMFKMKNSDGTWTKMTATLDKVSNKMYSTSGEVTKHGTAIGEFAGALKGEFLKLGRYMIASFGIEEVIQAVRTGITYVKEIDDALTDLKKVTNETDAGYARFLQTMSKTAGVVGSTVAELTTMAAEWARLGYNMSEAADLAESTAILLNVSEFENATEASEALISTIQAFGYAADDSMHVVDILNEVGKFIARR